ncbi:hypothetical protein QJS04_geneDACA008686 [Acorus gramineus]|uniref:Uncharacterized protein n=1 Tax=Acorus gramineus TaxID=55184 RepID=A0AAV9AED0_ACOGR|nr:hypothetical protein QJS04_geneDACA008686 [Acorus gramineus]
MPPALPAGSPISSAEPDPPLEVAGPSNPLSSNPPSSSTNPLPFSALHGPSTSKPSTSSLIAPSPSAAATPAQAGTAPIHSKNAENFPPLPTQNRGRSRGPKENPTGPNKRGKSRGPPPPPPTVAQKPLSWDSLFFKPPAVVRHAPVPFCVPEVEHGEKFADINEEDHEEALEAWANSIVGYIVVSFIGIPLFLDTATRMRSRISYARVCVEVEAGLLCRTGSVSGAMQTLQGNAHTTMVSDQRNSEMNNQPSQPIESISHAKNNPPDDKSGEETNQTPTLTTSPDKPMKIPQPKDGSSKQGSGEVQSVHEAPYKDSNKDSLSVQSIRPTNNGAPVEKSMPSINGDKHSVAPHLKESDQVHSEENSITTSQRQQLTKKQKKKLRQTASGPLSEKDEDQEADSGSSLLGDFLAKTKKHKHPATKKGDVKGGGGSKAPPLKK